MNYRDVLGRLRDAACLLEPSGFDGLTCGMLCAGDHHSADDCARELAAYYSDAPQGSNAVEAHDEPGLGGPFPAEVRVLVEELHARALAGLDSEEFRFEPLLPDDDAPMQARAEAFRAWCASYLHGVAAGGVSDRQRLSEEGREALGDIAEFTRLEPLEEDDSESEENERAFFELSEYLTVAVLLLREELRKHASPRASHESSGAPHDQTLH